MTLKIGVAGYSGQKFDEEKAEAELNRLLDEAREGRSDVDIASGLTNLGIPAIGYRIAAARGWETTGIACSKATKYECFPVDNEIIVGDQWGDESETFLDYIDVLVRVGGGKQTLQEVADFRERGGRVLEADLEAIPA
jgi:hypothetical protein